MENLGSRLMSGCASWILKATPGEKNWINPDAAEKEGVGVLLANKYAMLVTATRSLYKDRVLWIKMEGVKQKMSDLHVYMHATFPRKGDIYDIF